ncbi:metallophosphoesterase [Anaeromyxobacter sp. SG66]|uniref:metallophosphoesterase n=1 Tax=Anaeromyxobacter sp. SG66 TaxID=2925410 RepID=UPI001F55D748|nr:metallophosphoesterase [Anaeromyxobacter sp. SG66]
MNYDVIGDVHGHADALVALLRKLGYREHAGAWRHPDRTGAFVGDFVDVGPQQLETVDIIRGMVDAGFAVAVMGNHELNAIAWALGYRERNDKNRAQHAAFLAAVDGQPALHRELVDWFLDLPLWLELPELRVVHACWHERFLRWLAPQLREGQTLPGDLLAEATIEPAELAEKDTPEPSVFKAVEALAKGLEVPMPEGRTFLDKRGQRRDRVRVSWWDAARTTYRRAALLGPAEAGQLPDTPIPAHAFLGYDDPKPVFIGHYWRRGVPTPLAPRVACVDYSVALGGPLCAYRFDGEPELVPERFVTVDR